MDDAEGHLALVVVHDARHVGGVVPPDEVRTICTDDPKPRLGMVRLEEVNAEHALLAEEAGHDGVQLNAVLQEAGLGDAVHVALDRAQPPVGGVAADGGAQLKSSKVTEDLGAAVHVEGGSQSLRRCWATEAGRDVRPIIAGDALVHQLAEGGVSLHDDVHKLVPRRSSTCAT